MSKLSFLDGDAAETEVVQPTPAADDTGGPARGPDGKFVAAAEPEPASAPEPAPAAEPEPAPAAEPAPAPAAAPVVEPAAAIPAVAAEAPNPMLPALLDERLKRQKLEDKLAELEAKLAPPAEPVAVPDIETDPEGFARHQQQQIDDRLYAQTREFSRRFAVKEYGAEAVETVRAWAEGKCGEDAHFNTQVRLSEDPYEFVMAAWKKDQLLSQVSTDDLDEYKAWKALKDQTQAAPAAALSPPSPPPPAPPVSLATAPSAGGPASIPTGSGQAYDAVFTP